MSEATEPTTRRKVVAVLIVAAAVGAFIILSAVLPSAPENVIRITGSVPA